MKIEIVTGADNNPVAEFFCASNTPETDEQINGKPCTRFAIAAGDSLRDALVPSEFARKLERERDEAREALSGRTVSCAACNHAAIERDEAREKAERYRLEANAMMLQRDEAQKHLRDIEEYGTEEINAAVELRQKLADALLERDEARELADRYRAAFCSAKGDLVPQVFPWEAK